MRPPLPPGPYLVAGLARSGQAAVRMLVARGAEVIAVDSAEPFGVEDLDVEVHTSTDGVALLERAATLVKSPGVPREAQVVARALEREIEVIGELELAWRALPNRFLAVTGTNGKTTTVELAGEMLRAADMPVAVAGNVGTPLASLVDELDPGAWIVCECSSFQLEDSSAFAPEVAVLLNLEADHLDRHGTLERYREAKLRAFANQPAGAVAVAPAGFELPGDAQRRSFAALGGVEITLRGAHNVENASAAAAAALAAGVPWEAVALALRTFRGVPHRLEEVAEVDGVLYVNDSKATNVASAVKGLEAFDERGVHAILGGSLKGGGFEGLRDAVTARCRAAYLIGEAAPGLAADLEGTVPLHRCGTLERAVGHAAGAAQPGDVVLLSPACASFDAFRDYEHRGARFRELVRERSGERE
jgi:UDP-N-acetylmuramoylalanine--D-glutamate ligase